MRRSFVLPVVTLSVAALALSLHSQTSSVSAVPVSLSRAANASPALPRQNTSPPFAPQSPQQDRKEAAGISTVIIDPAHGGPDSGARGPAGIIESEVVLDFARAIRVALEAQHLRALLTREGNQNPTFDDRSAMVNGLSGAIFVSLHVSSTGPLGTARVYFYALPPASPQASPSSASSGTLTQRGPTAVSSTASSMHPGLVEWDRAQEKSIDQSRQLAVLVQTELALKFKGSPDQPLSAPVRQLRTIAAPAIAVEVSSIEEMDVTQLQQMSQPLAEAIARAIEEFRNEPGGVANTPGGGH
jgi:N-acetylmuramoyl-L-alanine amidase